MDVERVALREGYRYEDLGERGKRDVDVMAQAVEDLRSFAGTWEAEHDGETVMETMEREIGMAALGDAIDWMRISALERQITLAEEGE